MSRQKKTNKQSPPPEGQGEAAPEDGGQTSPPPEGQGEAAPEDGGQTSPEGTGEATAAGLVDRLEADYPEPTGAKVEIEGEEPPPPPPPEEIPAGSAGAAGLVDSQGRPFDSRLHVIDGDGHPILTGAGRLKIKPGRKVVGDAGNGSKIGGTPSTPKINPTAPINNPQYELIAAYGVQALDIVRVWVGGAEYAAQPKEKELLHKALYDWAEYEDVSVSPRWVGVGVCTMFIAPALTSPKGREKLEKLGKLVFRRKDVPPALSAQLPEEEAEIAS